MGKKGRVPGHTAITSYYLNMTNWKAVFLAELAECGIVSHSARAAGVGVSTVYNERQLDPDFGDRWEEAIEASIGVLEHAAFVRGVQGVDEPVYSRDGEYLGTKKRYSDNLLMFLLKARDPRFKDKSNVIVNTFNLTPKEIMAMSQAELDIKIKEIESADVS